MLPACVTLNGFPRAGVWESTARLPAAPALAECDRDAHPHSPGGGGDKGGFVRHHGRSLPGILGGSKRPARGEEWGAEGARTWAYHGFEIERSGGRALRQPVFPTVGLQPRIPFPGHGSLGSRDLRARTSMGSQLWAWSVAGSESAEGAGCGSEFRI